LSDKLLGEAMLDPEFARATCKNRFVDTSILSEPDDKGKLYLSVTQHLVWVIHKPEAQAKGFSNTGITLACASGLLAARPGLG
ncbi:MAG: hypothetical protein WBQ11_15560, partial [Isosphaeraceae bacterium]